MYNKTIEDYDLSISVNNFNSKINNTNSPNNLLIENCFFFTLTDDKYKDTQNNESNYQEESIPSENFFDTKSNTGEILENNIIIPIIETNNEPIQSLNIRKFEIINKKKGRPKLSGNKKEHDKHCLDNILTKIQAHFLSFIIELSNDAIKAEFGEKTPYKFKHLSYAIKKQVNFNSFYKNKNCFIKDILIKEISNKYKCKDKNINEKTLKEVCKRSSRLKDFFNLKYIKVFLDYYNIEKPITKIEYNEKPIKLSEKTKSIYYLLEKNNSQREEIKNTIKQVYLNIKTGYCFKNPFTSKKKKID